MQHKEPIRVLHMIASLGIGGSQTMITNLYKAIDRNEVQFDFIIDHTDDTTLKQEIVKLGGKIFVLPSFNGKNVREIIYAWDNFFVNHPEYKILHTHSRSYASIYLPIAKRHGLITIAHSHNTSNGKGFRAIIKDLLQLPVRHQADYMFACSQEAGEWMFGKKAIKSDSFRVIPNAIDSKKFAYNPAVRDKMRAELGLQNSFVIGHVGRMTVQKNHDFLLRVFAEFQKGNRNAKLLLIGAGEMMEQVHELAKKLGVPEDVIFVGSKNNIYDYYQAMDCFVFPSLWEGFGMVVLEAQASGLPCIVSDSVPKTVNVGAGLVEFVNLKDSVAEWAGKIHEIERRNTIHFIEQSGYDIYSNVKELQRFYKDLVK